MKDCGGQVLRQNIENTRDFVFSRLHKYSSRTFAALKQNGVWSELTYSYVETWISKVSQTLRQYEINPGSKIALLSESSPEYLPTVLTHALEGCVSIPLDALLTAPELEKLILFSQPKLLICSPKLKSKALAAIQNLKNKPTLISFEEIHSQSATEISAIDFPNTLTAEDLALIVFTSGTTLDPKGVMILWKSLVFEVSALNKAFQYTEHNYFRFLSLLPMNHLFEFTTGALFPFSKGGMITYCSSLLPTEIAEAMKEFKSTDMVTVPLALVSLKKSILSKINAKKITRIYFKTASFLSTLLPQSLNSLKRALFFPIHKNLGGKLIRFYSGAAALDLETATFFENLGIHVFEGYGLTETSPVLCVNTLQYKKKNTVGKPLPGVEIKLDPQTKEILARGPNLMVGYYERPELSQEAIDSDGWFHTGDEGYLDSDGFLKITGRIKELIVLNNGKKVTPTEVEEALLKSPFIKEVCVVGAENLEGPLKGTPGIFAIVVPYTEKEREGLMPGLRVDLTKDLEEVILDSIKEATQDLAHYKRPTQIIIQKTELPKTTTRKVKRFLVKEQIENLKKEKTL